MRKGMKPFCVMLVIALAFALPNAVSESTNTLVVSVPTEMYFEDAVEAEGLRQFCSQYPDWKIEVVVQSEMEALFDKKADVYFVNPTWVDIAATIESPKLAALDAYLSQDTKENVYLMDQMMNAKGETTGIPVFIGVTMLHVGGEQLYTYIESKNASPISSATFKGWDSLYDWMSAFPFAQNDPYTALVVQDDLTRHLQLMATSNGYRQINFNTAEIREVLTQWKAFAKAELISLGQQDNEGRSEYKEHMVSFLTGLYLDWDEQYGDVPLYMPIPGIEKTNSCPLAVCIGAVSAESAHPDMAVLFIECFISPEAQLALPTGGLVRKDAWAEITRRYSEKDAWAQSMERWGNPILQECYENYAYSITHGRIGIGSYRSTQTATLIVKQYLMDEIDLDTALNALQTHLEKQLDKWPK